MSTKPAANINHDISHQRVENAGQRSFWTVSRKLLTLVLGVVSLVFAALVWLSAVSLDSHMRAIAQQADTALSEVFAETASGAIRWGKAKPVQAIYDAEVADEASALVSMHAFNMPESSKPFAADFSKDAELSDDLKSRLQDIRNNPVEVSTAFQKESHLMVAIPVFMKGTENQIGVLVTVWDTSHITLAVDELLNKFYVLSATSLLILGVLLYLAVSRGIGRKITRSVSVAKKISMGDLDNIIDDQSSDEIGQLSRALNEVQLNLKASDDSEKRAVEFGRIKQALDSANISMLVADQELNIVYVNDACIDLLNVYRGELMPEFSVPVGEHELIGESLDLFSVVQDYCKSAIRMMESEKCFDVIRESLALRVTANPVTGAEGERIGTVFEWADRTREVKAEQEVQKMVDAAAAGDFSLRIDASKMDGFYAQMANNLNQLAEISETGTNDTLAVLQAFANGQLDRKISREHHGVFYELQKHCNETSSKLTDIVGQIRSASRHVSQGANRISDGNNDLAQRTEQQAANLEETAAAMQDMSSTVKQSSAKAEQAKDLVENARREAERGGEIADRAINAVNEITQSSNKIADIIDIINDIAFQTNLLALNASVEAARAGDKGRGFAVVASEVRDLAGRSATASNQIKELIEDSLAKVREGERLVGVSGDSLDAIVGSVKEVTEIVTEIADAGLEQAQGINQINTAVKHLDITTQENAALVEQAHHSSRELDQQAQQLDELMRFFRTEPGADGTLRKVA